MGRCIRRARCRKCLKVSPKGLHPFYRVLTYNPRYCLSHSPVPVIVIRPERKVRKSMAKRRADPKRGQHFDEYVSSMPTRNE